MLVEFVHAALHEDNPKIWAAIAKALQVARGAEREQPRRARLLAMIDAYLSEPLATEGAVAEFIHQAALQCDERFADLDPAKVKSLLARVRPTEEVRSGGAGNIAPPLAAARLSVSAGAFDDDNEATAQTAFRNARLAMQTPRQRATRNRQ